MTRATRSTASASTLTSALIATAPISFAAASSFARSRPQMATRAPRCTSRRAVSNPIPEEPPVTSALALSIFMPAFYVPHAPLSVVRRRAAGSPRPRRGGRRGDRAAAAILRLAHRWLRRAGAAERPRRRRPERGRRRPRLPRLWHPRARARRRRALHERPLRAARHGAVAAHVHRRVPRPRGGGAAAAARGRARRGDRQLRRRLPPRRARVGLGRPRPRRRRGHVALPARKGLSDAHRVARRCALRRRLVRRRLHLEHLRADRGAARAARRSAARAAAARHPRHPHAERAVLRALRGAARPPPPPPARRSRRPHRRPRPRQPPRMAAPLRLQRRVARPPRRAARLRRRAPHQQPPHPADAPPPHRHANLLGWPHLYGFSAASLDRLAARHGFDAVRHISSRHIPPTRHRLTATARVEEERAGAAAARLEAALGDVVIGPWFETIFSRS